jgi:hypothetical protein
LNHSQALNALDIHSGHVLDDRKLGLVGKLRPYSGLSEPDFAEIMNALLVLSDCFGDGSYLLRPTVRDLWHLCEQCRTLALEATSPLRATRRIGDPEALLLAKWVSIIERTAIRLLSGHSTVDSMSSLYEYISVAEDARLGCYAFALPLLDTAVGSDDEDVREYAASAKEKLNNAGCFNAVGPEDPPP